jgi:eukaryotic-like serine/threonine-protein kinase
VAGELQIPGIEIGAELGHGAHSVVYRATRGTKPCAVKVPRGTGRTARWAYRDAVSLARVRHPGLPRVLEVGEVGDLPYVVLELVLGQTLAERLRHTAPNEHETLGIVLELVDALSAIHDAGLVHRDVNPHNIVLDPSGSVRLIDLGFGAPGSEASAPTDAAAYAYAAPEQFRDFAPIDARADLYAVGQVLLECVTGRPPSNDGGSPRAASMLGRWALPVGEVVAGLLAESPDERYPDARALLSELDRIRSGQAARGPAAYHATGRPHSSLVGRQSELGRLDQAWRTLASVDEGSVVVVEGQRGGGKTSLLTAFAQRATLSGFGRVISISCRYGDPPLAVLRRMLEAYMGSMGRTSRADRAADEAALRASASGYLTGFATLIAPKLTAVLGDVISSVEPAPGGFPEGVAELVGRLALAAGPLLLCVDDVQWIDPISRQVLLRVAEKTQRVPLMLVLSTRPTASGALLPDLDPRRIARIGIPLLDEQEISELVAAHLGEIEARPDLARRVASLADGTPLGVSEVLGAMLDLGALRPSDGGWVVDVERMSRMVLPQGSLALFGRRLGELSLPTREILEIAALLGTEFDDETLAGIAELPSEQLRHRLAEARRAGLLEIGDHGCHRFVHDSAREMLTSAMGEVEQRGLHSRIAHFLEKGPTTGETLYAVAAHYGATDLNDTATRAYPAARKAATSALERFDNETALRFLDLARRAADVRAISLDAAFFRSLGEANLRLGALEESLDAFETALDTEKNGTALATLHGRIAWVEQARGNPERAWAALSLAFGALDARIPEETIGVAAAALRDIIAVESWSRAGDGELDGEARKEAEVLCDLHVQNSRLGYEYGKPMLAIASTIAGTQLGKRIGKSRSYARSLTVYGFVLTSLGFHRAGARALSTAERMASELHDPIIVTRCAQTRAVSAAFAGHMDLALTLMRQCVDVHGPWLEANEYCLDAATGELIESLRGRCIEAWAWITRAVERQRRSYRTTAVFDLVLIHRARACLVSLGQSAERDSWLAGELERTHRAAPPSGDFHRGVYWGARARSMLDQGDLGPAFEELIAAFEAEGHDPKKVHLNATEYYVAVAHGRVNQFLRAPPGERDARLRAVEAALANLARAAKLPLLQAHALFVEGFVATFRGKEKTAKRLFGEAEALAAEETAPWVSYAVARARAHHLRDEGKLDAAMDQARIAEVLACEHGAEPRARWIREEFSLTSAASTHRAATFPRQDPSPTERRLAALLRLLRSPHLRPEQQAATMLADLLRELEADRAFLVFQPDGGTSARLLMSKGRHGEESSEIDPWREQWLETIRESRELWPPPKGAAPMTAINRPIDPERLLAAPLFLGDAAIGVTSLERSPGAPPFSSDERELFLLVSRQMPIALEIAHLFVEREQLHASLRQAQKMEAVGQLAGGIAHDFNNMLTVIQASLASVRRKVGAEREVAAELEIIADATQRAGRLMRQLLGFSRHQAATPRVSVINDLIAELLPMLQKLAGDRVSVALKLDPDVDDVMLVRASFDQAMVNLVVNARDAMPDGGSITIMTKEVTLDENALREGALRAGHHVVVRVTDSGSGISPEHIHQVFDPFFTTKEAGSGTGLGLTTVYAFVRNSGGHVEVESTVGLGTTISLYFPVAESQGVSVGSTDDRRYASLS